MKKYISVILAILMAVSLLTLAGWGSKKAAEPTMAELLVGDWYSYSGAPYRSFSADGTVVGTNGYASDYTVEGNLITWKTAAGNTVTVEFFTDGEILRIATGSGGYFTTRMYYCKNPEGVEAGTGMPRRGTTDTAVFGTWYNGADVFFTLNEDGSVSGRRDTAAFSFFGDEIVLFTGGASVDEAASCKLENDILTIFYKDELTGADAELTLTKEPTETVENVLDGLTDNEIFLPDDEAE